MDHSGSKSKVFWAISYFNFIGPPMDHSGSESEFFWAVSYFYFIGAPNGP
jgi:hypothetical protein